MPESNAASKSKKSLAEAEKNQAYKYVQQKNFPAAIKILERQVARSPENPDARLSLGSVFEMAKQPDRAAVEFEKCAQLEKANKKPNAELHLVCNRKKCTLANNQDSLKTSKKK
jgi:Tfp pilus assembly protein PilF